MRGMNSEDRILGFDVGGTKSAVVVGTTAGEVLARRNSLRNGAARKA